MRIQVLSLPDELVDGELVPRFALVLDEYAGPGVPPHDHDAAVSFRNFARDCGAKAGIVMDRHVDIVEDGSAAEVASEIVTQLDELIARRLDEHAVARKQVHPLTISPSRPSEDTMRWFREASRRSRVAMGQ